MDKDYTVTFPVHLGQQIWVDSTTLPTDELAPDVLVRPYFKAEVRGLKIQMKGDTARKSIQFRVKARWRVGRNQLSQTYHFSVNRTLYCVCTKSMRQNK